MKTWTISTPYATAVVLPGEADPLDALRATAQAFLEAQYVVADTAWRYLRSRGLTRAFTAWRVGRAVRRLDRTWETFVSLREKLSREGVLKVSDIRPEQVLTPGVLSTREPEFQEAG